MSEEQLNRTVRQLAWWPLLRAVVPLIAVTLTTPPGGRRSVPASSREITVRSEPVSITKL